MRIYRSDEYINRDENIWIHKYTTDEEEPKHRHEFIELVYIQGGSGRQTVGDRTWYSERGDLLFLNFGDTHAFVPEPEYEIVNILIRPEFMDRELVNSENALDILTLSAFNEFAGEAPGTSPVVHYSGKDRYALEALMGTMLEEFTRKEKGYRTVLKGCIHILLTGLFRRMMSTGMAPLYADFKQTAPKVLGFIEENYNKKLSLKQLSGETFYNPSYFSKMFKECFGQTVTEYIHARRMDKAVELLTRTDLTIETIAERVGYQDKKQFYKLFKERSGMTPSQFRRNT